MDRPITLVTGVSRGIGLAIAQEMTRQEHHVVGLARTKPLGFEGTFFAVDLSNAEAAAAALATATRQFEILRLVNNAGMARMGASETFSLADYEAMMTLNVRAVMQCCQAVLPGMRQANFGRIVNIGSRAAQGKEGRMIYGATKAAVLSMTRSLALDYARHGITVNCIAPGPIETDMIRINYPVGSDSRRDLTKQVPAGRFGQPQEVAHACAYFLSDEAAYTTGQVLYVCGGLSVGRVPV
ncbi:MAG: SDR family oxidoreductase [Hyphomicrobiaceae bacterium]